MLRGFICVLALTVATAASAAEPANPAHAIAQKFAAPTESAAPVKNAPAKAQSAKAQSAKAGAENVLAPNDQPAKSEGSKTVEALPAALSKPDQAKAAATSAERPPLDYEMEMLRRARAEQAVHTSAKADTKPQAVAAPSPVSPAPVPSAALSAGPVAVQPVPASAIAAPVANVPPPATVAAPAIVPMKTAEAAAPQPAPAAPAPEVKAAEPKLAEPAQPAAVSTPGPMTPATLLLALETHSSTAKGSAAAASFDPVICLNDNCFISGGLQSDAIKIAKSEAIKLKSTDEVSPASCKGMIACIYRNVAVPAGAQLQLIELGSASHEAARASDLKLDKTCRVTEGELACDEPMATPDFKVWVVPEETARAAGAQAIEEAVADGLPHVDVARSTDK